MNIDKKRIYKKAKENFEESKDINVAFDILAESFKEEFERLTELNAISTDVDNVAASMSMDIERGKHVDVKTMSERMTTIAKRLKTYIVDEMYENKNK